MTFDEIINLIDERPCNISGVSIVYVGRRVSTRCIIIIILLLHVTEFWDVLLVIAAKYN